MDAEIDGTISAISAEITAGTFTPGEILVLTHRRLIGERIRDGLRELEIPVETFFTEEELGTWQAQEALALLRLALDPDDRPALRVILGIGHDQGRSAAYRRVWMAARTQQITPHDVMERLTSHEDLRLRVPALLTRYARARQTIQDLTLDDLETLINQLFAEDVAELAGLRSSALQALSESNDAEELLGHLIRVITQDEVPQHPTFVRIMSLHKSKGLTSPRVYVVGLIEGVVPTYGNRTGVELEESIDEQRRLLYVAMTRTATRLTLSCCAKMEFREAAAFGAAVRPDSVRRLSGVTTCDVIATRYLKELGLRAPRARSGVQWLESLAQPEENGE